MTGRRPRTGPGGDRRNWAGNVEFSAVEIRHPASVEELQHIVRGAARVRAVGTGHSFNDIADTTGTMVSLRSLRLPIEVQESPSLAVVPAGATYAEVATALYERGWALPNLGSLPHISVGGACATGTHGSGVDNGCLASAVRGVELVRADGDLLELHEGDPDFPGAVLSLGLLGVATRLWLRIEPTFDVSQDVLLDVPFAVAVERAEEILASAYSVSIFSGFGRPGIVDSVWRKHRLGVAGHRLQSATSRETWGGSPATADVHPLLGFDARAATEQGGRPGPWHLRLPHFRAEFTPSAGDELQSEYLLPRGHAGAALQALGERADAVSQALQVFEMRTVAADDLWLSPYRGRDTVAVHATWVSDLETVRPAVRELEAALEPFDPRPHWGKVFLGFDAARFAQLYPAVTQFREVADRLDPDRCFVNDYARRVGVR
jgi:alditol oxidase